MVEQSLNLDSVFSSLADSTRRDILGLVAEREMSISQIAKSFSLTFAAVSKHLMVLEKAKLIVKRRRGKEQIVSLSPETLAEADQYLRQYQKFWESRLDALDAVLKEAMQHE